MRYPEIEPYEHGLLEVGDGNLVYWEASGNPRGKPALVVHGGPGSGSRPERRRFFDPERYRIIQFDQRGCGQSRPSAADPATDMSVNTTHHLLDDMERLREHLGVDHWLLFGGSWGSTLSLAYAEQNPKRVSEIVLLAVTTGRHSEIDWLYYGVRRFFPEAWERFRNGVPPEDRNGDLLAAYTRLVGDPDPEVRLRAARDWCAWEDSVLSQRSTPRRTRTVAALKQPKWHLFGSAPTTSPTTLGLRTTRCSATSTGSPASQACCSTAGSTRRSGNQRLGTEPGLAGLPPEDLRRVGPSGQRRDGGGAYSGSRRVRARLIVRPHRQRIAGRGDEARVGCDHAFLDFVAAESRYPTAVAS
jgi:proline iminopeptidase